MLRSIRSSINESIELQLVRDIIASADRRWFCDGLANWIAIQECERRYGDGRGQEIFESIYQPDGYHPLASEIDLFAWPTAEDIENGSQAATDNPEARYYFATLAMQAACADQGPDFIKDWLTEIRKTPRNRTNTNHILAAYQTLTDHDLRQIVESVTTP